MLVADRNHDLSRSRYISRCVRAITSQLNRFSARQPRLTPEFAPALRVSQQRADRFGHLRRIILDDRFHT